MKKKASFVTVDTSLANWISEKLQQSSLSDNVYIEDLVQSFRDLIDGEINNLVIELSEENTISFSERKLCFGTLTIYPKSRKVLRDNEEIFLTPKEFDILYFLAKNKGEVFTKEQIYQAVWNEDYLLSDSNIMAFIRKLRKKIESQPDLPEYIITIWGIGYKFNEKW